LNIELFKKVVDEIQIISPSAVLRIHSVGEPLYWKNLVEAVQYSRAKNVKTWLFTCAVTGDRELLSVICENVDIVEISVNSTNNDDYLQTKGINAFYTVKENIIFMKNHIVVNSHRARLIASRVQTDCKEDDDKFVQFWKESGWVDDAFVRSYHTYSNILQPLHKKEAVMRKEPCLVHWARFNIDTNGDVYVCFNELFKENRNAGYILGNIYNHSIKDIWQGEKLKQIREAELCGNYSGLTFCKNFICKNCNTFQPLTNKETSEKQINIILNQNNEKTISRASGV
jgi:radical SAM protein with 4Fe4S-binding SPASM domain